MNTTTTKTPAERMYAREAAELNAAQLAELAHLATCGYPADERSANALMRRKLVKLYSRPHVRTVARITFRGRKVHAAATR